jgi:prolyl-tRNA editing enzyme YbaK/EbsC (Cys-tRNA(Pro) deacylase)
MKNAASRPGHGANKNEQAIRVSPNRLLVEDLTAFGYPRPAPLLAASDHVFFDDTIPRPASRSLKKSSLFTFLPGCAMKRRSIPEHLPETTPMSLESVRAFFAEKAPDLAVIESDMSSATVALAAQAYGVEPGRIAKTLSLRVGERVVLIVASGTARMDNRKVKARFGGKPKMLDAGAVAEITGHEVGGVCPFGLKTPLPVYCDVSLQAFDEVVPAAGSTHSAVRIAPMRMAELTSAEWVDVCGERVDA